MARNLIQNQVDEERQIYFWEKIYFRIGIGVLLPIFVSFFAIFSISIAYTKLSDTKGKLRDRWASEEELSSKTILELNRIRLHIQNVSMDPQPNYITALLDEIQKFRLDIDRARVETRNTIRDSKVLPDKDTFRYYPIVEQQAEKIRARAGELIDASAKKNISAVRDIKKSLEQLLVETEADFSHLHGENSRLLQKLEKMESDAEVLAAESVNVYLIALLVTGLFAGALVSYSILSPLLQISRRFRDIATGRGDLTKRIHTRSGGEMGELAYWINAFLDKTQQMTEMISGASEIIRKTTDIVSEHTNKTNLSAAAINKSMTEQSMDIDDCTLSVSSIDDLIQTSSDSTKQAASLSKIAMDRALQGGASVHETIEAMVKIEESAQKIEVLVSSINEIASQTNLLAVNAAIEASKAGEHGKGFAVVAEEVRKLAEKARRLTGEVNVLINESGTRVKSGVNLARGAGNSLDGIIKDVEAVVSLIQRIASSASKQTESSTNVLNGMKKVSEAVRINLSDMQEVTRAAEFTAIEVTKLDSLVEQLNEIVGDFKSARRSNVLPIAPINQVDKEDRTDTTIPNLAQPPKLPALPEGFVPDAEDSDGTQDAA